MQLETHLIVVAEGQTYTWALDSLHSPKEMFELVKLVYAFDDPVCLNILTPAERERYLN